ncbi:MAG TPA: ATP-binding protein [Solirubrobacterales bacterium]
MGIELQSRAEKHAEESERLEAFSGLKLLHIRKVVTELLSLIGRNGLFDQYTKHDISHIDRMLALTSWLIPEETWKAMSPTDSLLQVLSIYLHDLGMLVTEKEYEQRANSSWHQFVEELYAGDRGEDYKARVEELDTEAGEKFLYQEYVRAHHGERVRAWISGTNAKKLGDSGETGELLAELLGPLPALFREDLGLVCESHHRSDLADVARYPTSRPYGQSDEETANVQYAAFVLRTADLLHITSDRTPSVMFKMIAPSDPLSQEEWAKQAAVTAVRSKVGVDDEGNIDHDAPRDTVEVVAQFTDEDGFFGLTAYLTYATAELRQTYDWAEESVRRHGSRYSFPWKFIDESQILTSGFLRDSFEFSLDTKRVLDLLTGHTLYNNTAVVLRELVQNSLDAIRAQRLDHAAHEGEVNIVWDSASRRLAVQDNGTGMSQADIERHLLRVGSSKYQDPEFRREHPEFSPISRFGIGVLSTFMVADAVSIETVHPDDAEGRQLNLRSVHGRYLVRLFDKGDPERADLGAHGTRVTLSLRPSASLGDVAEILAKWIVVPGCKVNLSVDGSDPESIGHESISEALAQRVEADGLKISKAQGSPKDGEIRLEEVNCEGCDLAFAKRWSAHFQEWSFVQVRRPDRESPRALGIAVEGIRVEETTPGYREVAFYAMANTTGVKAPRTDVSRSGLEQTPERLDLFQTVYGQYAKFVASEIEALRSRGFSLTWSAQEARFLSMPLTRGRVEDKGRLEKAIGVIPSVVVDDGSERRLLTPAEVEALPIFWTIESNFFRSAESVLRETPSTASVTDMIAAIGADNFKVPRGPLVTSLWTLKLSSSVLRSREVSKVIIDQRQRRVDLAWEHASDDGRWLPLVDTKRRDFGLVASRMRYLAGSATLDMMVARGDAVEVSGGDSQTAVRAGGDLILILPGSPLACFLEELLLNGFDLEAEMEVEARLLAASAVDNYFRHGRKVKSDAADALEFLEFISRDSHRSTEVQEVLQYEKFAEALAKQPIQVFDAWAWDRGSPEE